jgi:hypothetical protein
MPAVSAPCRSVEPARPSAGWPPTTATAGAAVSQREHEPRQGTPRYPYERIEEAQYQPCACQNAQDLHGEPYRPWMYDSPQRICGTGLVR